MMYGENRQQVSLNKSVIIVKTQAELRQGPSPTRKQYPKTVTLNKAQPTHRKNPPPRERTTSHYTVAALPSLVPHPQSRQTLFPPLSPLPLPPQCAHLCTITTTSSPSSSSSSSPPADAFPLRNLSLKGEQEPGVRDMEHVCTVVGLWSSSTITERFCLWKVSLKGVQEAGVREMEGKGQGENMVVGLAGRGGRRDCSR